MAVRALDVRVHYPEPEKIYEAGSADPIHIMDGSPSYAVQIVLDDGQQNSLTFEGQDLQITYWDTNAQYQFKTNAYVIEEMEL